MAYSDRTSRGELLSTAEVQWFTTKTDGMWNFLDIFHRAKNPILGGRRVLGGDVRMTPVRQSWAMENAGWYSGSMRSPTAQHEQLWKV